MSIYNFSNLIKPENSGNTAKTETTKLRASEPSFKDLVKKIVDEKHAASQNSAPTPEPVTVPTPIEKPVETKSEPEVAENTEVVVEENLPAVQETEIASPTHTEEIKVEAPALEKTFEQKDLNHVTGEEFLKTMLTEFSDLLIAGNELAKIEGEKAKVAINGKEIEANLEAKLKIRHDLRDSLVNLLTQEDMKPDLLNDSLDSYQKYLAAVETSYSSTLSEEQKKNNSLIILINQKKKEISQVMEQIGGTDLFKEIKEVVKKCRKLRAEGLNIPELIEGKINPELVKQISQDVTDFVENDLHGAKMLAEEGNIVNIFIAMYNKSPQK